MAMLNNQRVYFQESHCNFGSGLSVLHFIVGPTLFVVHKVLLETYPLVMSK